MRTARRASFPTTFVLTFLFAAVVDAQQRAKAHLERLENTQEELRKREAEVQAAECLVIVTPVQ